MKTRRVFDVAVLGGSTAALVSACLLRRDGYKVLHIEHDGLSGRYRHEGRALPAAPDLLPLPRRSPLFERLLEELALTSDARRLLEPLSAIQVLAPGRRFELPFEPEARRQELVREFGEASGSRAADAIDGLIERDEAAGALLAQLPPLPPDGLLERRTLRRLAAELPAPVDLPETPVEVRQALGAIERLGAYLASDLPSPLGRLRATAGILRGVSRGGADLGPGGYGRLLRRRFAALGGERPGAEGGVIASLGVRILLAYLSGMGAVPCYLIYDELALQLRDVSSVLPQQPDCPICGPDSIAGWGDHLPERFQVMEPPSASGPS